MANSKKALLMLSLVVLLTLTLMPINVVTAQDESLFEVTIIAPGNANILRRQWGQIIANSLQQLGIDARVVYLDWVPVFDRVLTPPLENVGKTYDEGGYDMQLIGWTPGLLPEPGQTYYGSEESFAPTGNNYYLWNNTEANRLMDIFITTTNDTERDLVSKAFQSLFIEEVPGSQIFCSSTPTAVTPELGGRALVASPGGEGWLFFNAQPNPEMLTGKTSVVYASTGEIESLLPPLSNSWYDTIIYTNIYGGLVIVSPDLSDLTVPCLLTNWESSADGFNWTFTTRTGVKWHDGVDFTADDVVFSYWALMNPATGTQHQGTYSRALGNNVTFTYANGTSLKLVSGDGTRLGNVTAVDSTTVELNLPELLPGKPYGYWDPYLLGLANNIIPKHIFEKIEPADWTTSPFNTGDGTIVVSGTPGTVAPETYDGPVGTGPYKWVDFDPVAQLVHLEKFNDYWNKTALEADGLFGVTDYYVRFIADKTPALAALANEEVDMLDPQYQIQVDIEAGTIDSSWGKVLLNEGTGRQEVGYNMRHPIFGTGVDTPLGKSDPTRAAEAAKYVRIAFDYAIPRQLIIDNLIQGYGEPGATYWLPTYPYYNSSVTARSYDLNKAKEYLAKAGYTVPGLPPTAAASYILGMSTAISGYYPNITSPLTNRELMLMVTSDNSTYPPAATKLVGRTTTDLTGWYTFTVTPSATGTYYYYLLDPLATTGTEYAYAKMLNVTSFSTAIDPLSTQVTSLSNQVSSLQGSVQTLTAVAAVALIVAIVLGGVGIYMGRKRP